MTMPDAFRLGEHNAQINALREDVSELRTMVVAMNNKMDTVLAVQSESKGERRAAAYIGGLAGTLVSIAIGLWFKLSGHS